MSRTRSAEQRVALGRSLAALDGEVERLFGDEITPIAVFAQSVQV